jgi:hypothetical protein
VSFAAITLCVASQRVFVVVVVVYFVIDSVRKIWIHPRIDTWIWWYHIPYKIRRVD